MRLLNRFLRSPRLPILYYHEIGPKASKHVVTPQAFAAQMGWLGSARYQVLSMDEVARIATGRARAPERAVALTFDDGRAGVLRHVAPLLQRLGWPATIYAVTDWLDGKPVPEADRYSDFLAWRDLAALCDAGMTIGSHTCSHRNLKKVPEAELRAEVEGSRRRLEEQLGRSVAHFSFPKGRATRAARRAVRNAGYRTAVRTGQRVNGRGLHPHSLFRLRVHGEESLERFQTLLEA